VAAISEFNQKAYELFAQPLVQAMSNETTASLQRQFNPMRVEQWAASDQNPWLAWVGPVAEAVKAQRKTAPADSPFKQAEGLMSELISASLDYYRDVRDAASEAAFFQTFGVMFPALHGDRAAGADDGVVAKPLALRELPVVREALAAVAQGGYAEALARAACLLVQRGEPFPLARVELKAELGREYEAWLPPLRADEWREIRGRQEIICRYEPERAVQSLPSLLEDPGDRERFLTVLQRLLADPRLPTGQATPAQRAMLERILSVLAAPAARPARPRSTRKLAAARR
jgi:hypothetical protein